MATIIGLENVLDELEGWVAGFERERGRDPGLYYLRVFGDPAGDDPWSWRFGGHHVSINHLVIDGDVRASTPLFLGADPASSPLLGPHVLRPLAGAEDLARELVRTLDPGSAPPPSCLPCRRSTWSAPTDHGSPRVTSRYRSSTSGGPRSMVTSGPGCGRRSDAPRPTWDSVQNTSKPSG